MAAMLSPKSEALTFRLCIWARERDWNCTMAEAAEAMGVSLQRLSAVASLKGWQGRFRAGSTAINADSWLNGLREIGGTLMIGMDGLEALGVDHGA